MCRSIWDMMRHICHCWPEKYLIKIFQQTVLAMDPDSRIVVETVVLPIVSSRRDGQATAGIYGATCSLDIRLTLAL